MNKRNDFICIGAVHSDYELKLKQNYFKNRTNPINQNENLGGVAFNIAKTLSFLKESTKLYSLNCNKNQKNEIKKYGIKFIPLNKKITKRYYAYIMDKKGKMILGLANMDNYEKLINSNVSIKLYNKNIILDLSLSKELIQKIINKNFKKNYICVCGTSAHKIFKIKKLLNKIDLIIMNKQEIISLTNKKTIKECMNYLVKKYKNLNFIITNGKNSVNAYINNTNYISYPPRIKIKNENGAGDALSAVFNYFYCNHFDNIESLKKSICGGALKASGHNYNNEKYLQKLDNFSRSIKYKIIN